MICDKYSSSYIDGKCFVAITYPFSCHDALLVENLRLDEITAYIRDKQINKAYVQNCSDFSFLTQCQSLEYIAIELRAPFDFYTQLKKKSRIPYDLSSLQNLSGLVSLDIRENEREGSKASVVIDISKLEMLQSYAGNYKFIKNLSNATQLRSLRLTHFDHADISELAGLSHLDTLHLSFSKIQSLDGCSSLPKLQCLYLHNNRSLEDISDLEYLSQTLTALRIENCSKIQDFSVLESLSQIELLELSGRGTIPSLSFIRNMPHLKTLIFSMDIIDGDLSFCDNLSWVYSEYNRRHFNRNNTDLPRVLFFHGNEGIDEWRRLE